MMREIWKTIALTCGWTNLALHDAAAELDARLRPFPVSAFSDEERAVIIALDARRRREIRRAA